MEKTMAQAIYKRMEIGKAYTTSELFKLLDDEYYNYIPFDMQPGQPNGKPVNQVVSSEMYKAVNAGYVRTYTEKEELANVRGIRYGSKPTSYTMYTLRYWVRIK